MAYLSAEQLTRLGFAEIGREVLISEKASIYGASRIRLGSHVRIDDFCILSAGEGGFDIGSFIHIAAYSSLIGAGRISLEDFANLSSRVSIYSSSDDYSGSAMTSPMVPEEFTRVDHRPVTIGRHVIIGSGSVILPGVTIDEGASVGALSLVTQDCPAFTINAGCPAEVRGQRRRNLLDLDKSFQATLS